MSADLPATPATMQAVPLRRFGPPEVLALEDMPTPEPGPGEVLIRVEAVSVGRLLDIVARSGQHPYATFTFPHLLGAEHAGRVAAVGPGVSGSQIGDRVAVFPVVLAGEDDMTRAGYPELSPNVRIIGTHRPGAYAQYSVVPATNLLPLPDGMPAVEAVGVVLAAAVAMNQFDRAGGVGPGSRVVVQGATSALGSTTALLARHLGAEVLVTSRSADKRAQLGDLGFTHVADATAPTFTADVLEAFGGAPATLIVDNLGDGQIWQSSQAALGAGGVIVTSGAFLDRLVPLDLRRLYSLGQRVIGVRSGNLGSARKAWLEVAGGFRGIVDRTFDLADAAQAHRYVEAGGNVGRVALTVPH